MRCPVTGAVDHPVSWRCYALGVCDWLAGALPYQLARRLFPAIAWLDRPFETPQTPSISTTREP